MPNVNQNDNEELVRIVESNSIEILGQKLSYPTTWYGVAAIAIIGATVVAILAVLDVDRINAYAKTYQESKVVSDGVKVANAQQVQIDLLTQLLVAKKNGESSDMHIATLKSELRDVKIEADTLKREYNKQLSKEVEKKDNWLTKLLLENNTGPVGGPPLTGSDPTIDKKLDEYLGTEPRDEFISPKQ